MKRLSFATFFAIVAAIFCSCQNSATVEVVALQDNLQPRLMATALFAETAPEGLIESLGLQQGIPSSVCAFMVTTQDKQILFDAGNGAEDSQLLPALSRNGYSPSDIDYVMITHMHGDHIGGLTSDGKAVFANAKLYIPKAEYDGWMAMGEERSAQMRAMIAAYGDRVVIFGQRDALPCDVEAIDIAGHTPGHTAYRIGDVVIAGDLMHGVALQLEHPEVCARFDMDHAGAIASRKMLIEMVRSQGLKMYGMHFPAPHYLELE